ncbi:MAG: hypothetical protein H7175_06755 [Burkholderiales bacterium]|nr:hypothetical protein [Anaerolineae bacterium]
MMTATSTASDTFLQRLLRAALHITRADRALAVDSRLQIIETINMERAEVEADEFKGFANIRAALDTGEPIVTNNVVFDPAAAPTTNTNFSNLRAVVVIPVAGYGALYLDQRIRNGIIPKKTVERLNLLARQIIQTGGINLSELELIEAYRDLN